MTDKNIVHVICVKTFQRKARADSSSISPLADSALIRLTNEKDEIMFRYYPELRPDVNSSVSSKFTEQIEPAISAADGQSTNKA